jgi:hypothetical protein
MPYIASKKENRSMIGSTDVKKAIQWVFPCVMSVVSSKIDGLKRAFIPSKKSEHSPT